MDIMEKNNLLAKFGMDEKYHHVPQNRFLSSGITKQKPPLEKKLKANESTDKETPHQVEDNIPLGSFDAAAMATALVKDCTSLPDLKKLAQEYDGCELKHGAKNLVFGVGIEKKPAIMVIGDAPDATEDATGEAFSGRGGNFIKKILSFYGYEIDKNLYFTNSLYWKRPGNRQAHRGEQMAVLPFLLKQIELIAPEKIWLLGLGGAIGFFNSTVAHCRTQENLSINVAGKDMAVVAGYEIDYYLGNPLKKKSLWQDVARLIKKGKE